MGPFATRLALLVARRKKQSDGLCTAEQADAIDTICGSRKGLVELSTILDQACMTTKGRPFRGWQEFLEYIIDNWDQILAMIMSIIQLFSISKAAAAAGDLDAAVAAIESAMAAAGDWT